jgi:Ca2+-binding RTX toxin-like protein
MFSFRRLGLNASSARSSNRGSGPRSFRLETLEDRLCLSANAVHLAPQTNVAGYEAVAVPMQVGNIGEPAVGAGMQSSGFGLTGTNNGWIAWENNVVSVHGTNVQDNVQVEYTQSFGGAVSASQTTWLRVRLTNAFGTQTRNFSTFAVTKIEFFAHDGNDIFNNVTHINSLVEGGAGHDSLTGGSGNDDLRGRDGNDVLRGNGGNDLLYGGDDFDYLEGGAGNDTLAGNNDWDRLFGGSGNDLLSGGLGGDELEGGSGSDEMHGDGGNDTLRGNSGNDNMFGGIGHDQMFGGLGNDKMRGNDGNDTMEGGAGDDQMWGNDGFDLMFGGMGNDWMDGGDHNDEMHGGSGSDDMYGGYGNDEMHGGIGHDQMWGQWGNDHMDGDGGDDTMYGGSDDDHVSGGSGDDSLFGNDGEDSLFGGSGNDFLSGGDDDDYIHTGDGNDTAYGDDGDDRIYGLEGNDYLVGGIGDDKLVGGDGDDSLYGSAGKDELHGQNGNDFLFGGSGNDQLWGHAGNDHLEGGSGDDDLFGGDGNDELEGDSGLDGLFGGRGNNTLDGGSGADRILTYDTNGNAFSVFADTNDEILGLSSADAVIKFITGDMMWDDGEVEVLDAGFALLHRHPGTRHTELLKSTSDGQLTFIRRNVISSDELSAGYPVGNYDARAENGNTVHISQKLLDKSDGEILSVVVHELGHFWQNQPSFQAISGWTQDPGSCDELICHVESASGDWWYSVDALGGFLSGYAALNPWEDFATTFAHFFTESTSHANSIIDAKLDWMADFLDGLA